MTEQQHAKQQIRKDIASQKKLYTKTILSGWSEKIQEQLEETELFRHASCIALYHAIPGEVQTASLIEKWHINKQLLLPLIEGDDLLLFPYTGKNSVKSGIFGILEPLKTDSAISVNNIDLIIIPGVAFDRQFNRLGRGRGYYDRLLSSVDAPKVGICFNFQLIDKVPTDSFDKKMDMIITEKDIIV